MSPLEVLQLSFADDGAIPNNPSLPLLIYPTALENPTAQSARRLVNSNGWAGDWAGGVFPYHHYHSVSHEVLVVVSGHARIAFGGPEGEEQEVRVGDVVIIPAGVGHCAAGSGGGFTVVGAYPRGQERWDLCTGAPGERPRVLRNIRNTPLPHSDPIFGAGGPLTRRWGG